MAWKGSGVRFPTAPRTNPRSTDLGLFRFRTHARHRFGVDCKGGAGVVVLYLMESPLAYIPADRRHALASGVELPSRNDGAVLFADISGFTALSEALAGSFGPARGAEELSIHLNGIYDALVAEVDAFRGSVMTFSGDAITCWFASSGDGGWLTLGEPCPGAVQRAVACALRMQKAMRGVDAVVAPGMAQVSLAVKIAVAAGPVVRFVVGDPAIQRIDVLAGETLQRLAAVEHHAGRGDVVLDEAAALALCEPEHISAWRGDAPSEDRVAVVTGLTSFVRPDPWPTIADGRVSGDVQLSWLLPPVASRLSGGLGEFLTELRPAVSLFLGFDGIDYDGDPNAPATLDAFVRSIQATLADYGSCLLQLTIGDKGSYINAAFGAPVAHEDDAVRAVAAALELCCDRREQIKPVQIGIAQGRLRAGAYGSTTRRTYGVLGDDVNLAARLMQHAVPGTVLVDRAVCEAAGTAFIWEDIGPIDVKGKLGPVVAARVVSARNRRSKQVEESHPASPMVGREGDLAVVLDRFESAVQGAGQVVDVTGDAGMGKSRLVAEAIATTQGRMFVSYVGECQSYGSNTSYHVWHNIFRSFFALDRSQTVRDQVATIERCLMEMDPSLVDRAPLVGTVVGLTIPDSELTATFEARLRKESLESLLSDCVRARASERPLLFVLEDCHWLDPLSRELLDVIARGSDDLPVVIITTQRPSPTSRFGDDSMSRLDNYCRILLSELPDDELAELIQVKVGQLFGESAAPAREVVAELILRAQGNPFFILEMLNLLRARGRDVAQLVGVDRLQLPDSLHGLILSRIDQLSEGRRTVLKVASVIGRLFDVSMLGSVYRSPVEKEQLVSDLTALADLDFTVLERPEPNLSYLFKHALTQEVAYSTLPFATRSELHRQLGEYLEEIEPERTGEVLDLLAYHFDRSNSIEKRREYLTLAARASRASFANQSAIDYLRRAIPLLDGVARGEALADLGELLDLVDDWAGADESLHEARSVAISIDDAHVRARTESGLGLLELKRARYDEAFSWLVVAREGYVAMGDSSGVSRVMVFLAQLAQFQGDFFLARSRYEESLVLADLIVDAAERMSTRALVLNGLATVAIWQGDYETGQQLTDQSLALRREAGNKAAMIGLLANQAILSRQTGDLVGAQRVNDQVIALVQEVGDRYSLGQLLNNQACVMADQGDFAEARTLLTESLRIRRQLGDRAGLALSLNTLADVLVDERNYVAAVPVLDESLALSVELGNAAAIPYLLEDYAGIAAASGQARRALCLAGYAETRREILGTPLSRAEAERLVRMLSPARDVLPPGEAERAYGQGRSLALIDALEAVLAAE